MMEWEIFCYFHADEGRWSKEQKMMKSWKQPSNRDDEIELFHGLCESLSWSNFSPNTREIKLFNWIISRVEYLIENNGNFRKH